MQNRSDVILKPSMAAGLIAAVPWLVLLASTLTLGIASVPLLLAFVPVGLAGAVVEIRRCGLLRSRHSVIRLAFSGTELRAELGDGREYQVHVTPDSRLTANFAFLKISPCDPALKRGLSPTTFILLGGNGYFSNTQSQPFRELRAWLRLTQTSAEVA